MKKLVTEEIKNVVMKNAKKGKFTTTKYVGPYNYKSGFDNYFALSFNKYGEVIIYSSYQNDRGEQIDTSIIKLSDLDEKVLNEVYKNLNTKDEGILSMLDWYEKYEPSLYTRNTDILIYLGIIKPQNNKKKEKFTLDIKNLPELENKNDAYYVDRKHNVGVLKYIGEIPLEIGHGGWTVNGKLVLRLYSIDGTEKVIETAAYRSKEPKLDGSLDKAEKNKGCFKVLDKDNTSYRAYIFVPNKEQLISLFEQANKAEENKEIYIIDTNRVRCIKSKRTLEEILENYNKRDDVIILYSKEEAITKFEKVKQEIIKKIDNYSNSINELLNLRKDLIQNHMAKEEFCVNVNTLKPNDKFIKSLEKRDKEFTIDAIDEYGAIHLKEGGVLHPKEKVLPCNKIEDALMEKQYANVRDNIRHLENFIKECDCIKIRLKEYTPFLDKSERICVIDNLEEFYNVEKAKEFKLEK